MKITYNPELDVAYIVLREQDEEVVTHSLGADLHIDLAHDGSVHGIELLDAKQQLFGGNGGLLEFFNQTSHERVAVTLPQ